MKKILILLVFLVSLHYAYAQSCNFDLTVSPNTINADSEDEFRFTLRTTGDAVDKGYGIKLLSYPGSTGIVDLTKLLDDLGVTVGQWVFNDYRVSVPVTIKSLNLPPGNYRFQAKSLTDCFDTAVLTVYEGSVPDTSEDAAAEDTAAEDADEQPAAPTLPFIRQPQGNQTPEENVGAAETDAAGPGAVQKRGIAAIEEYFASQGKELTDNDRSSYEEASKNIEAITSSSYSTETNRTTVNTEVKPECILGQTKFYLMIPKCFSSHIDKINFNDRFQGKDFEILQDDPLIGWTFDTVVDKMNLSYEVSGEVSQECIDEIELLPFGNCEGEDISEPVISTNKMISGIAGIIILIAIIIVLFIYIKGPKEELKESREETKKKTSKLKSYIKSEMKTGKTAQEIREKLAELGYSKEEIDAAFR